MIKLDYIDNMGCDLSVVNAARVSFDKKSEYIEDSSGWRLSQRDKDLIRYLAKHNHWSPFTHTCLSFRVKVPIFIARQLQKHQVGLNWNEVSRRYVDTPPEFFTPDKWRDNPESVKQGSGDGEVTSLLGESLEDHYDLVKEFTLTVYESMIDSGVCAEQARMVLPQSMMTEAIWTGNLASFARVYNQRSDPHAQKEVQEVATLLDKNIAPLYPVSWEALTTKGVLNMGVWEKDSIFGYYWTQVGDNRYLIIPKNSLFILFKNGEHESVHITKEEAEDKVKELENE